MLSDTITIQFSFFIIFALLGTVLSIKLKQPYVVGLLILGMIAGPNVSKIINNESLISTFSELGAILLLFSVGLEFSVSKILSRGTKAVFITAIKMGALFFIGYMLALFFGLNITTAIVVGLMISITSTAIMFKIFNEKNLIKNPIVPLLFTMLIIEDLAAVAGLTFISTLETKNTTYENKILSFFLAIGILGGFYLFFKRRILNFLIKFSSSFSQEALILFSFSLCLLFSILADLVGLSSSIGAFLAGSIIAEIPNSKYIEKSIKPLILLFSSLFFLSLGVKINPNLILENIFFAVSFTLFFVISCFVLVFLLLRISGSAFDKAIFGASSMVVLGEFSLLFASIYKSEFSNMLISIGSFGVIASTIVSSFLLDRQTALLQIISSIQIPAKLSLAFRYLSIYIRSLLSDFSPKGLFFTSAKACFSDIKRNIINIAIASLLFVFISSQLNRFLGVSQTTREIRIVLLSLFLLFLIYQLFFIFLGIRPLIKLVSQSIARPKKSAIPEKRILKDIIIIGLLILVLINVNEIIYILQLPSFFLFTQLGVLLLISLLIYDLFESALALSKKSKK
jgi:Kef-type K+ transport system membrane component KefB